MVVEFISDTALVRRLARNVTTADFTDAQIISEQKMAYSMIGIKTGKFDWDAVVDAARYPAMVKFEEMLAAAYILMHYGSGSSDETGWINFWMTAVKEGLQTVVEEGTDAEADTDVLIAVSDAQSYPYSLLDYPTTAIPYRSTTEIL